MRDADGRRSENPDDDRAPFAKATDLVHRILSACLIMALPVLGGYYVDRWLSTAPLFLIAGAMLGFAAGFWQIYKLARIPDEDPRDSRSE